jgi:hypothetical protein
MESVAGPQGRAMLEKVLNQIDKAEAKFLAENGMANEQSRYAALALSALWPVHRLGWPQLLAANWTIAWSVTTVMKANQFKNRAAQ